VASAFVSDLVALFGDIVAEALMVVFRGFDVFRFVMFRFVCDI
jgi:hypothetical protein